MKAEQYRPNFFSGFEQSKNDFNTTEELLNIEWVKSFKEDPNFHQFSITRDESGILDKPQHTLMAEYENGFKWWVVAFIRDKDISGIKDLPEWISKHKN